MARRSVSRVFFFVAAILFVVLVPCGVVTNIDGAARYAQTKALLFHHSLAVPVDIATGRDGRVLDGILAAPNGKLYSKYGIAEPVLWIVPTALAWLGGRVTGFSTDLLAGFAISLINPIILVLIVWSMVTILGWLGVERRVRWWTAALYVLGTSILGLTNSSFSEPMVALLLLWACALPVFRNDIKSALASGALLSLCALTKTELALLPLCALSLFLSRERRHFLVPFFAGAAIGPVAICVMNLVCRGSLLRFSYGSETSQFHAPWQNALQQFVTVDNNILVFNSALALAVIGAVVVYRKPRWRALVRTAAVIALVYIPFYMSWWAWGDAWAYGTRFVAWFMALAMLPAGVGLQWLLANARRTRWSGVVAGVLLAYVAIFVPLQVSGLSVIDEEAADIHMATGESNVWTHQQLLAMKLRRGIKGPEIYHKSDFVTLAPGEPDSLMDYRSKRTFQYLYHWWAIYLANKARYGRVL